MNNAAYIAASIGAAISVLSTVSIFIYEKITQQRQKVATKKNLENVHQKIAMLEAQLEALRLEQTRQQKKKKAAAFRRRAQENGSTYTVTDNDTDIDAFSTAGTDFDDDEFFDFSDNEAGAGDSENVTSDGVSELDSVLVEVDRHIEENSNRLKVIPDKLQILAKSHSNNVEVVWRVARAHFHCSENADEPDNKKTFILEGLKTCETVIHLENADLHKWYAILVGKQTDYLSSQDKIKNGFLFKKHLTKALELRPTEAILHYLLGRFKFEVSSLTWFERKVASSFFGEPPSATYEEALIDFKQAEKLASKPNLENKLYLAKTYLKLADYQEATLWLETIKSVPDITKGDRQIRAEAEKLLGQYSRY